LFKQGQTKSSEDRAPRAHATIVRPGRKMNFSQKRKEKKETTVPGGVHYKLDRVGPGVV